MLILKYIDCGVSIDIVQIQHLADCPRIATHWFTGSALHKNNHIILLDDSLDHLADWLGTEQPFEYRHMDNALIELEDE